MCRASSRDGEIAAFEAEIAAAAEGRGPHADDQLVAWTRYVEWLRESHPSGSPRVVLALERAVHTFKSSTRYQEDPRYVRLWVLYAASRDDQLEVFSYMRSNRIGSRSALFYEGWANTLERAHMFDKARAAYELGQQHDAQPVARLKARFDGFEARMAARKRRDAARAKKAAAKASAGKSRSRPTRQALGAIGSSSARPAETTPSTRAPAVAARPPARVRSGGSDDPLAQRRALPPVTSDGSFEVYVDVDAPPLTAEQILDGADGEEMPFPSLVRAKIGTRENRMDPEQWRGAKIKQDKKLVRQIQGRQGPVPEFEVYCDPPKHDEHSAAGENNRSSPVQELLEAFRDKVSDVEDEEVARQGQQNTGKSSAVQTNLQKTFEAYQDKRSENEGTSDELEVFQDREQSSEGDFEVYQDSNHGMNKPTVSALSPIPEAVEVRRQKATPNRAAEDLFGVYRDENPEVPTAPASNNFEVYKDNSKAESFQVREDKKSSTKIESFEVFQDDKVQGNKPKPLSAIPQSSEVFQDRSTGLTPQFEALTINPVNDENGARDEVCEPIPPKSQKKSIMPDLLEIFKSAPQEELSDRENDFDEDQENFEVYQDQKPNDNIEVYQEQSSSANRDEESFEVFHDAPATVPQDCVEVHQDEGVKENGSVKRDPDAENVSPLHSRKTLENQKKGILKVVDQENIPRCDIPSPPLSPAPVRRNPSYIGGVSPTINTKIAARNIENMFNSPLPQEEEEDEFTLMRGLPKPTEESFQVYRDPAHATPGKSNALVNEEPFEVYRDPTPVVSVEESFEVYKDPAPGASSTSENEPFEVLRDSVHATSADGDDEFVIRPDRNGSSFSVFNELLASMNKENGSDDEAEPSDESQRRLKLDEVLTPIPELEGVAPSENLVAVPVSFGYNSKSPEPVCSTDEEESNLLSDLHEWCELERNYYVLDNALAVVKEGRVLKLDAGHGDIRKISVDGAAVKGYRGTAEVFAASAVNPSNDLAGFGPIKNKDGVVALKVQKNSAWEFYIYKTLHERLNRRVADIPVAMAVFDDQCISRSVMLLNCMSDGSMAEILRMTPNNCFSESVALFFTVAILRAVEAVHECGIVHTDVTLDNLLLRNEDRPLTSPRYSDKGKDGWDEIGVFLIDFNMAFDTRHSSITDSSPATIAEMTAKRGLQHLDTAYRKSNSSLWAFDADCHAITICTAKMLGLRKRDVTSYVRLLRHERVWETFFREMSALSHLSTPSDTIAVMRRNRTTMEGILVKDFTLKSSLTKVIMHITEAKYAADVTKTMGL